MGKIKRTCQECQKNFEVWPSGIRKGEGKFCSRKCFGLSKKGIIFHRGVTSTSFKKGHIPWHKGKKVPQRSGSNHHFFGKECTLERRKKISMTLLGITKQENWKGFTTLKDRKERMKFRETIQKTIFKRDSYTCNLCGANDKLQVNHKKSWKFYPQLRFDPANCETLCMKCHYSITFGKTMPKDIKTWGHNFVKGGY